MKKLFLLAALFVAAAFPSCSKHDNEINDVEPPVPPETTPLAIAFAEGDSLEFNAGETKTVHYTITGGSDKTVVRAELQNSDNDNAYEFYITQTSATEGTIKITAKVPSTDNRVIVTVSDGSQTIMAAIDVAIKLKASFDGKTVEVKTAGTLAKLLADYDKTTITELTVIGNLNDKDIKTLEQLPNLAVLDMEHVNLKAFPVLFYEKTSLTSIKLPLTLKTIGTYAFSGCSGLTSVTIPDSVTSIKSNAFNSCSGLTSVTIPDSVTSIKTYAFCYCSSLTSVTIGNSVTSIGYRAFYGCSGLTSVTIPDSVTVIGSGAFYGCSGLTSVTIGNSVTSIGDSAFYGCSGLTSVTIPDSVTVIGDSAFVWCSGLTSVTIGNSVTSIGDSAFNSCSSLTSVTIGNSVTTIGTSAFYKCSSLTSVTIPDSVTTIGSCAFYGCSGLTSVTIPDSVTSIKSNAFNSCSGLTSVTIPDSVTVIGSGAFEGCSSLRSVYITDIAKWSAIKLTGSSSNPLYYAHNLYLNGELVTELVIPDSVTTIGNNAFNGCSSLTSVTIPDNVTKIGQRAFSDCSRLTSIYCKAQTPPSADNTTFNNINTSATLYVPTGCKAAYAAAYGWNFTEIIETQF